MAKARTAADLTILDGPYRGLEWFWDEDGSMPALDVFEGLPLRDQDDFVASIEHWGNTPAGLRPVETRINTEDTSPVIVAVKAGKHRFTAFREEIGPTWIVYAHYLKEGRTRDKTGDRAVEATKRARDRYFKRVKDGTYYERG